MSYRVTEGDSKPDPLAQADYPGGKNAEARDQATAAAQALLGIPSADQQARLAQATAALYGFPDQPEQRLVAAAKLAVMIGQSQRK